MKCAFSQIHYFHRKTNAKPITKRIQILGIDSETTTTGKPFMFGLSDDTVIKPDALLDTLFHKRYRGIKFVCWNLAFDEGSLLYFLPNKCLNELRTIGRTEFNHYVIRSIQKKELTISKGHKSVTFYDIMQFYGSSLDAAAERYLNEHKHAIETKRFTPKYIKENWFTIANYCVRDAILTQRLADYFIDILINEIGIYPQKLYSTGYIAGVHFARVCEVMHITRYWQHHKRLVELAFESYSGGKFEVYKRGFGYFYQYDINSAYPYEIANLRDIRTAKIVKSKRYRPLADYGFLRCKLTITNDYSPVSVKRKNLCIYPNGMFEKCITKREYEYLTRRGDKVEILEGYWLFCSDNKPYRREVERLYSLKNQYKRDGDNLRYLLVKILLNSFYGKFIQITPKYRQNGFRYEAGFHFNPMYASVITANIRLRMCEVCDNHPDSVVAVHTDSVITDENLSNNGIMLSKNMGDWDFVIEGSGVVVGSGVYQIGDNTHYRGFKGHRLVKRKRIPLNLVDVINENKGNCEVEIAQELSLSWRLIVFRNSDHNRINRFVKDSKKLNLNFDYKRDWLSDWSWSDDLIPSKPIIYFPEFDKLPDKILDKYR